MFGSVIPKQMCTSDPQSVQNIDMVTVNEGKYGKYKVPQSSLKKNPSYKDSAACSISASSTKATLLEESVGLIPRVFKDLILKVARVNDNECDTKCVLSFYEIYNDKIRDLLAGDLHSQGQGQRELKQREHPVLGPYIEGLKKFPVTDVDHMLKLVSKGNSNRNYNLSDGRTFYHTRSHAVVVLELVPFTQLDPVYGDYVSAPVVSLSRTRGSGADYSDYRCVKVQMVELAGPEKCSPSSVNILEKLEANKIGTSLSTLGRVIHSLVKTHSSHSGSKRTPNHRLDISGASGPISVDTSIVGSSSDTPITDEEAISYQHYQTLQKLSGFTGAKSPNSLSNASKLPFRESLLTWLLKDGLYDRSGVRGFVSCIATISPAGSCYEESLQVLHFAHRLCCRTSFPALDIDKFGSKDESGDLASPHPPDVEDKFSDGFDKIIAEEAHVDGDNLRLLNAEMGSEDVSYGLFSDENLQNISFVSSVSPLLTEKKPEGNISNSDALLMEGVKYGGASSLNTTKTNVEIRSSPELGSVGNILGSPSSVAIRDTYRELHSRLVEMQIELQNTKTDRDSLRVELLGSRETIAILQAKNAELRLKNVSQSVGGSLIGNSASNDATSGLNMTIGEEFEVQFPKESPSAHTKPSSHGLNNVDNINVRSSLDSYSDEDEDLHQSVLYLKGLIARKEHTIEGLLSEVKEERRFREAAEKLNETQMLDFLERVDSLRR